MGPPNCPSSSLQSWVSSFLIANRFIHSMFIKYQRFQSIQKRNVVEGWDFSGRVQPSHTQNSFLESDMYIIVVFICNFVFSKYPPFIGSQLVCLDNPFFHLSYFVPPFTRQLTFPIPAICRFAEPLALTSVYPYLPEMIESFGVERKNVAKWAGITSAVFSIAQCLTAILWGRASDKFGRKPSILCGLTLTMCCTCE